MAMLPDCLFAQVLSGSAAFQTDSFQEANSSQSVSTFAMAILEAFLSHIFSRTRAVFVRATLC
jgi:hypothetical protein